jgi:hypothetical protein
MSLRLGLAVLLATLASRGCLVYEYEHEIWLNVDGSGSVYVTGPPALWTAFKGLGKPEDPGGTATPDAARALFEASGLRVRRATLTHRGGRPYLFVAADFSDVNRLSGSRAFPDLDLRLVREGDRLRLSGTWRRPDATRSVVVGARDGLMAVRFHLAAKIYDHRNASDGVERGNILGWRQELSAALAGNPLVLGATMAERSILGSTVALFGWAIAAALALLGGSLYLAFRTGRRPRPAP